MQETIRVSNRIYRKVTDGTIEVGDVIQWMDWKNKNNTRTSRVSSVGKKDVGVDRGKTNARLVPKTYIRACWRWHKKMGSSDSDHGIVEST